ncbi:MAG: hypothetical protein OJF55_002636 [Rhodanobacteraceae bacterium]|jgi:hypothetical protein|nr:MAG: hypothetical protein OJF55_002636 [Rhodanobacteraceae bacterium]
MVVSFRNDDAGYLKWVHGNPGGYVVNVDEPHSMPQYPMVHSASHKAISSSSRSNYTTGRYLKFCSVSLEELERWSKATCGRRLTRCAQCVK